MTFTSISKTTALRVVMSALALFALAGAFSTPEVARAQPASSEETEQVIITSPYVVRREPVSGQRAPGLRNPELVSVSRGVSYADLDLSKASDVAMLQTRARNTARDICQELNRLYPKTGGQYVYSNTDCLKKATDDAMEVIKQVTAVAGR